MMDTKKIIENVELTETRAAADSVHWHPDHVANNINRSLRSLESPSLLKRNEISSGPNQDSAGSCSFKYRDELQNGTLDTEFFSASQGSSINNNQLLDSLRPRESLPELESPSETKSNDGDYENSINCKQRHLKQQNTNKSKMAFNEPDVDYSRTLRNIVEEHPDYDFAPKTKNKTPGGILLPIAIQEHHGNQRENRKNRTQPEESKSYPESLSAPEVKDLSKLPVLREDTINKCLQARYKENLIYTRCGDIMISVNPFKDLGIYTKKEMESYNQTSVSDDPHLYVISARAYQDLKYSKTDQVILVSGESGAGKTEATKLLVQHIISMAGSKEESLQEKIIQVNPLLENFGNAKTVLNTNSSRFAKYLKLNFNHDAQVQSSMIQDFMLEKSRVFHYQPKESTYHSFYALLAGMKNPTALYINPGQTFRITGDFSSTTSRQAKSYKEMYDQQQKVFQLLDMEQEEREDVDVILAAILHIGEIEFDDDINDCVLIKNEDTVQKVANLLDLNNERLTTALIERRGKVGKGEFIQFSKKKRQADDERDALAKTLYEKLFGWIVRKINDALVPVYGGRSGSIGILDICGFEDVDNNTFEQLCINIINEHLQNFMNRKIIKDERDLYEAEGIFLDVDTENVNNDDILEMFTKRYGILDSIDEDSKVEVSSDDHKMVRKLDAAFAQTSLYIPSTSDRPEFSIKHFAGNVKYNGRSFIKKNCDNIGDLVEDCLKESGSLLVKDLFHVPPSFTGTISTSDFKFQGSRRSGGHVPYKPLSGNSNLSQSINQSRRASLKSRFGSNLPAIKSDMANKKTHIHYFKNSLDELHRNMVRAIPYFVRCIKPNDSQRPDRYDEARVLTQLRYNGITEIARIRSCGLPVRMVKGDFIQRFGELVPTSHNVDSHAVQILHSVDAQTNSYKIGNSQIFMTSQVRAALEADLTDLRRKQEEEKKIREQREKERKRKEEEEMRRIKREREMKEKEEKEDLLRRNSDRLKSELKQQKQVRIDPSIVENNTAASSGSDETVYNRTDGISSRSNRTEERPQIGQSRDTVLTSLPDGEESKSEESDTISPEDNAEFIDHFQEITEEEEREDLSDLRTLKIIKVILYNFLCLALLSSLVIQKVSFITLVMELRAVPETGINSRDSDYLKNRQTVAYFMLIIVMCIPYGVGLCLSVLKMLFGISKAPSFWTWIWVLSIECLHSVGMSLLVFRVMPGLDYFKAAYLMSVTAFIPSLLKLFLSDRREDYSTDISSGKTSWKVQQSFGFVIDFLAFVVQGSAVAAILLLDFYEKEPDNMSLIELIVALILVSAPGWENFSDGTFCSVELNDRSWFKNKVLKIRYELQECRHFPNTLAYLCKIGLTILLAYLLDGDIDMDYQEAFDKLTVRDGVISLRSFSAVIAVTVSAFMSFNTSLMSLKLQMQRFSFALPLFLATPATITVFYLDCRYEFLETISESVHAKDASKSCLDRLMWGEWYHVVIFGGVWLLSILVVCRHIWKRQLDKNSNINRLFLDPIYCGVLTTEQIMLNQRRHQNKINMLIKFDNGEEEKKTVWYKIDRLHTFRSEGSQEAIAAEGNNNVDYDDQHDEHQDCNHLDGDGVNHVTPKIYACATMWHETRAEMVQILKSLHRLDLDQHLRRDHLAANHYDPQYYEYEAHIFFDDAMERDDDNLPVPNSYVKDLVAVMNEACSSVHCKPMRVHPPIKMVTPYGGQLMWRMPGDNLLFVHLKDMSKIRNRKRWSQVMYMYYLLNYRLRRFCKQKALARLEHENERRGSQGLNIDEMNMLLGEEHTARSKKTFILALDGDTDFLPSSIRILLQRMDEENVGAACGRIHPIGKGPMIWYQKFEYAIGHWLQKATEHVFGCVLCSPGCFSLFRAAALMDANVVKRYTSEPTEPSHHLQYDQGEDRWLCTLLLQRGYRIEYAAGADAWTFAPEGFFEFYNQRRRWMPSTIANILDLLSTADRTRRVNPNISLPYVLYTWFLMFMTLLGPGTILMMMAGAFQLIFSLDITWAFIWSIVPAAIYTVTCFWLKSKWQLLIAAVLSIGYGFIMIIVIVGTVVTATTENIFHPSVIIMVCLLGIFFLTGLFHPKEWACLVHGVLYLLCIPSGYLLLVIYSICNLNDVSWGTREVPTKAQRLEMEEKRKKKEQEKLSKKKKTLFKRIFDTGESHISELTSLLKTIIPKSANDQLKEAEDSLMAKDTTMIDLLKAIEENTRPANQVYSDEPQYQSTSAVDNMDIQTPESLSLAGSQRRPSLAGSQRRLSLASSQRRQSLAGSQRRQSIRDDTRPLLDDPINPRWTQDPGLLKGQTIVANTDEIKFWRGLMDKYLMPIRPTPAEKKTIADGLKDLRNSAAFFFILINMLWMSLNYMFLLTEAAKIHLTYAFGSKTYHVEESVLGMSFVFLLVILLLLQFVGMIVHRMGTLQQLLSTTKIWGKNREMDISNMADYELTINKVKALLRTPVHNDEFDTKPPIIAEEGNLEGLTVTVRPSDPFDDNLMATVRSFEGLFETARNRNALDPQSAATLNGISRRFEGSNILESFGGTYRPQLPPRPSFNRHQSRSSPWYNQHSGLGMTANELRRMRPGQTIIENQPVVDRRNNQWQNLSAIGKSLNLRATIIQEEQARQNNVRWSPADVARNNHTPGRSRRAYTPRYNANTRM